MAGTRTPAPAVSVLWRSIEDDVSSSLLERSLAEALRRDPCQLQRWVVLVDAPNPWVPLLSHVACWPRGCPTILLDVRAVVDRLLKAADVLHTDGGPEKTIWLQNHLRALLEGRRMGDIGGGLRRSANRCAERAVVNACADYLIDNAPLLGYAKALSQGLPIAFLSSVDGKEASEMRYA
jgi:hypothetical protein